AFDYVMDMGTCRGDGTELFYARCAVLHAARVAGIAAYDVVWSGHIEIDLGDSGLRYQPGDALGVWYQNDPALVKELVELLWLKG
ncbi:aldolase/citrate lyase family protein, partial [Salmonella enterica subsp. enterica serovar Montevideo]|nr:aldolase/citrate lyase family protein [Salmonella enterica subsp. enterica serovar Montevideo]